MANVGLKLKYRRYLLEDWFVHLASEEGIPLTQREHSDGPHLLGDRNAFHITAAPIDVEPYMTFVASDTSQQARIDALATRSAKEVARGNQGVTVWYSLMLSEVGVKFSTHSIMNDFILRISNQQRITGWFRLGAGVLLEFSEDIPEDWGTKDQLLVPKAVVNVHMAVTAPCVGIFSKAEAVYRSEVVEAICTLALGRPVDPAPVPVPTPAYLGTELEAKRRDVSLPTLARRGLSLDVFEGLVALGDFESHKRVCAALLSFDAASRQERNPVAGILYVVAAEALTTPFMLWRDKKVTTRFIEFFKALMPDDLDQIISHDNFEEAFGIRRGNKKPRALREEFLQAIYDARSGLVHSGLERSYGGMMEDPLDVPRRALLHDFAEMAILRYIQSPFSSIVGRPNS